MPIYSHSRLSTFEQCPQKYKLHYIDKVETEAEESIEAFLGSRVHETLEKLYRDLDYQKTNTLEDLLTYFNDQWTTNWTDHILIVKQDYTKENYKNMAEKYVTDYYHRYSPFTQGKTISIEDRILITLDDTKDYKLQGYIDRLTETHDGYYEIHDYKTNSRLPLPQYIENDRQLALYSIGVKERYPDVHDIRLIWHFLKFDKEIDSTRTDQELHALKTTTIALIDTIEHTETYPAHPSLLCDWCEYKPQCPQWSHLHKLHEKPANQYLTDTGVQLVNKYTDLKTQKKILTDELNTQLEKLEEALITYSKQEHADVIFGTKTKAKITTTEKTIFPLKNDTKRTELNTLIKQAGKWDDVSELDITKLTHKLDTNEWPPELSAQLHTYQKTKKIQRIYLSKL